MALPRKGLRKLNYEDKTYGWKIRKRMTYDQMLGSPMTLAIQQMDVDKTQVLHVRLNVPRPGSIVCGEINSITPANVIDIIDTALDKGWKPNAGGKTFKLDYNLAV